MPEGAADPTLIVDDLLGPEADAPPVAAPPPWSAASTPTALRELMDWVSNEVFGPA
jgi:hypothetical protein